MNKFIIMACAALLALPTASMAEENSPIAFPGAEGWGRFATGGRGGRVVFVTNTEYYTSSETPIEGSLRAALQAEGNDPITIVFRTSGRIDLKEVLKVNRGNITLAGQTAPGDGICIKRYPLNIGADEVIIRYIRVRLGNETGNDTDAISCRYRKNIILDHVSASWSIDETMSVYHCENVTIQWCMITESLFNSNHVKGSHGFGGIWGSNNSSYHHNLIAHHSSRNVRWASGGGNNDYRNNVLYNWGYNSSYGGEKQQVGNPKFSSFKINFVSNYYKPGPATLAGEMSYRIVNPSYRGENDYGMWYVANNVVEGNEKVSADNWNGGVQPKGGEKMLKKFRLDAPWNSMKINEQSPEEAYKTVLANAGCTLPKRDVIDNRIVDEVRNGYATYEGASYKKLKKVKDASKKTGIIDSQEDVGGWPLLKSAPAPADSDHDGMPDEWEKKNGLNPNDPADGNTVNEDGYTNLEKYLNSLC